MSISWEMTPRYMGCFGAGSPRCGQMVAQNPPLRNCLAGGHSLRGSQQEGVSVKVWGPGVDRGRDGAGGEGKLCPIFVLHSCVGKAPGTGQGTFRSALKLKAQP